MCARSGNLECAGESDDLVIRPVAGVQAVFDECMGVLTQFQERHDRRKAEELRKLLQRDLFEILFGFSGRLAEDFIAEYPLAGQ